MPSEASRQRERVEFTIHFTASYALTLDEVWPDGAPEDPTAEDVALAMRESGSVGRMLSDWNLDPGVEVIDQKGRAARV